MTTFTDEMAKKTTKPSQIFQGKGHPPIQDLGLTLPDTNSIVSVLSHDLRSPLNSIIGFSEILLSERIGKLNPEQKKQMNIILRRGSELLKILDQIVDYCNNISHETEIKKSLLGLVPFLSATVEKLKKHLPEQGTTLVFDPPEDSCLILGDEQKLYQVMEHLIEGGVTLFKSRKIRVHINPILKEKDSRLRDKVRIDLVFTGSWNQKPETLFNWNSAINVPGRVRFSMQLSRLYMKLMEGDLSVSRTKGQIVFHLDLFKEEL